jgi:hypothetical protein
MQCSVALSMQLFQHMCMLLLGPCRLPSVCRALLEAVLGKGTAAAKAAAGQQRKRLPAAARNAVVAEAYNESEAHATAAGACVLWLCAA